MKLRKQGITDENIVSFFTIIHQNDPTLEPGQPAIISALHKTRPYTQDLTKIKKPHLEAYLKMKKEDDVYGAPTLSNLMEAESKL